jgi:hypothetical protein
VVEVVNKVYNKVYTKERWVFEGYIGKRKFAGYVEFENDILCSCGVTARDYESQFQRYDIDCNGAVFDVENDPFNICCEIVLDLLLKLVGEGEVVKVRIGKKEEYSSATLMIGEENDNDRLMDLEFLY